MDDNLSVMMVEKEKLNGGVSNGYSPDKSGLGFLGIFSLSLLNHCECSCRNCEDGLTLFKRALFFRCSQRTRRIRVSHFNRIKFYLGISEGADNQRGAQ